MINLAYVALHLDPAQPPRDICQVGERKHLVTPGLRRTRPARLAATGRHHRQRPRGLQRIAVGTALAGGPPRRSQRALLTHWAPALGLGVEPLAWEGMHHAGGW